MTQVNSTVSQSTSQHLIDRWILGFLNVTLKVKSNTTEGISFITSVIYMKNEMMLIFPKMPLGIHAYSKCSFPAFWCMWIICSCFKDNIQFCCLCTPINVSFSFDILQNDLISKEVHHVPITLLLKIYFLVIILLCSNQILLDFLKKRTKWCYVNLVLKHPTKVLTTKQNKMSKWL